MGSPSKGQVKRQSQAAAKQPVGSPARQTSQATDGAALQQALVNPQAAPPSAIVSLQRMVGNHATQKLIQRKLTVGPAGDQYEREADRVAQQVMRTPTPPGPATVEPHKEEDPAPSINRKAAKVSEGQVPDRRLQLARSKAGRVGGALLSSPLAALASPLLPFIGAGVGAHMAGSAAYKKTGSKILAGLAGFGGGLLGLLGGALAAPFMALAGAIPGLMGGLSSSMTFGSESDRQAEEQTPAGQKPYNIVPIEVTGTNFVLRGRRYNPKPANANGPGAGKAVILFSGSGGPNENQLEPLAKFYTKQGSTAFAINYRGFGRSRDTSTNARGETTESSPFMSEEGLVEDAARIYMYVTGTGGFGAGNIVLHGFSLGGAIAAKLAKRLARQGVRLGGLVLHSSIKTAYEAGRGGIGVPILGQVGGLITKLSAGSFDTSQSLDAIHQEDPDLPVHFMSGTERDGDQLALETTHLPQSARGMNNVSQYQAPGRHLHEDERQTEEHVTPRQKTFLATLLNRGRNRQAPEEVNPAV